MAASRSFSAHEYIGWDADWTEIQVATLSKVCIQIKYTFELRKSNPEHTFLCNLLNNAPLHRSSLDTGASQLLSDAEKLNDQGILGTIRGHHIYILEQEE